MKRNNAEKLLNNQTLLDILEEEVDITFLEEFNDIQLDQIISIKEFLKENSYKIKDKKTLLAAVQEYAIIVASNFPITLTDKNLNKIKSMLGDKKTEEVKQLIDELQMGFIVNLDIVGSGISSIRAFLPTGERTINRNKLAHFFNLLGFNANKLEMQLIFSNTEEINENIDIKVLHQTDFYREIEERMLKERYFNFDVLLNKINFIKHYAENRVKEKYKEVLLESINKIG